MTGGVDLVIKGARVADGLGAPLRTADVAVAGGKIAEIGKVAGTAGETVDADGLVLMPGIVDLHTHYDAQLTWDSTCSPSTALGVTTTVIGNCGFGIAPAPPERRSLIARNLSEVEAMSLRALEEGIDWSFETFSEYLALLRRKGVYPNVGVFAGHSTIRSVVMGEAASQRAATDEEVAEMRDHIHVAMKAGAIGFASSQSQNHLGYGGVPMPSRLAEESELRALVGVLGDVGRGVFQMTVGPGNTVEQLETYAADTGRPVVFSALFDNEAIPERSFAFLDACKAAAERGHPVYAQVACQPQTMDFTMANPYPMMSNEAFAPLKGADHARFLSVYRDADFRRHFREQVSVPKFGKIFYGHWDRVEVVTVAKPENAIHEGRTIAEIAAERGIHPIDFILDLALDENLETAFTAQLKNCNEERVLPMLRHESSVVSLSDAGAHLSLLCDAGYGLYLLGHWVRDRDALTLEEAVRQLTSVPADLYRIPGRGRIVPGAWADLLLFDPAGVQPSRKIRVDDLPGGGSRLIREPIGVHGVWVNGVRVFDGKAYCEVERGPGAVLDRYDA